MSRITEIREQKIVLTFTGDRETAEQIKDALAVTLAALTNPTRENASALFELGACAVIAASSAEAGQ